MEFTFFTITYNQFDYIVQHLESIKNQIEKYGSGKDFDFVLCDDCSKDKTFEIVSLWVEKNREIFRDVVLIKNEVNIGTVKNVLNGISLIKTEEFKMLAGDDIYGSRDIFKIYTGNNVVLNFTFPFYIDSETYNFFEFSNFDVMQKQKLFLLYNSSKFLFDYIANNKSLSGPATYYPLSIMKDEKLKLNLLNYKLIEDRPLWRFIFLNKKITNVTYNFEPLIYYRSSVGVTSDINPSHKAYLHDKQILEKEVYDNIKSKKYLNIFNYKLKILIVLSSLAVKLQCFFKKGKFYKLNKMYEEEKVNAIFHMSKIEENTSIFINSINDRVR